jgi:PIN domain nuclease of toxin-antitoxin system
MRLLLDTHTFIWYVTDNPRLSAHVKLLIEDENNEKLVSIASIWEMAIKHSIGRLNFSLPFMEFIKQQIAVNRIDILEILSTTLRLWLYCLCITVTHLTG